MAKEVLPSDLMNSVLGKLYDVLCNGDGQVAPKSEDNYLAWATPGIPFGPEEFDFCAEGLSGVYRKNGQENGESELSESERQEKTKALLAQDTGRKYQQAENFARLADFIPDTSGVNGSQSINVWNAENTLSQAYHHILRFSQVADIQPEEKVKAKLETLRKALQQTKVEQNFLTDELTEVIVDSPLVKKYFEKMQAHLDAMLEYNTHRVNALLVQDPAAVHFWALNGSVLRNKVKAAYNDWVTNGYKEQYEQIAAYISQVEGRSMVALKAQYLDNMDRGVLTGLSSGQDFFYSTLIPGAFAKSDQGWTEFTFNQYSYNYGFNYSSKKGTGGVGLNLGIFRLGGGGRYEREDVKQKFDSSRFFLKFKVAQIPIVRPWFNVNFLVSKYWRFDQQNPEFKNMMVSDGRTPPNGLIPAFTTSCIFIKDLELSFGETNTASNSMKEAAGGGGYVGWGPFHLGGSYSSQNRKANSSGNFKGQSIKVNGMQLVGFKCHMLPTSPSPNPAIKEWV